MEIKIKTVLNKYILSLALVVFFCQTKTFSQIGTPTYAFTQICASPSFNSYTVNFTFSGANTFVLEMSDANGSFLSLTPITILSSQLATSPGNFVFKVPTTTAGAGYKLRVRGTSPAITGSSSAAFAAYFQAFNQSFYINNKISTASICSGGSYTLSIDSPTPSDPSPISFPSLKYKWYKGTTAIPGEIGTSINITTSGIYHVEIDYGSCTTASSITKSQDVTVNIVTAGSSFTITSSGGTTICPSTPTTLSTAPGYSYQWFKDNAIVPGATSNTYTTGLAGIYYVMVGQGSCSSTSNTITLTATSFNASIDVLELPQENMMQVGETKTVTVTTNASNPSYQWYSGATAITGETNSSFSTSTAGTYKVAVTQTTGCVLTKELFFKFKEGVNAVNIPNVISPNDDGINDLWIIPQEYISANTEVLLINSLGEIALKTKNYQNNWPESALEFKSVNPVYYYIITKEGGEVKKGSITIVK
ncbi:T9SS type B sorting domain-containing protein [Flavobacterium humi]|uniref:Gliding motility-associated C-terminal domain-containing protein n=1 Tax=Flavobacterium humi TaxID=2562683 RepID=A0A4Z0L8K0_9FLAO|nr:gliding motility-associated C-terminal domain-containing protein [Flavobacterium humi]TGD58630.1 gliding motility-associated C-terminal domain-containing protein [Flavobacterium humi]